MDNIQILIQDLIAFLLEKEKHKLYNKSNIYICAVFGKIEIEQKGAKM